MSDNTITRVGLAILGCGYMGGYGVLASQELADLMAPHAVPELVLVVEPEPSNFQLLASYCVNDPKGNAAPLCFNHLTDALPHLVRKASLENIPILVYDATPAPCHALHFAAIHDTHQKNLIYIGEKPLVADPGQIATIESFDPQFPIFCELIESSNPVVRQVQRYIVEEQLQIKSLWFWRANSSGLMKLIRSNRNGVQGGALLDKAPHDFSISMHLLGSDGVYGRKVDAGIHALVPHADYLDKNQRTILDSSNESAERIATDVRQRGKLPADGLSTVRLSWSSPTHGNVDGRYLFSWLGVTGTAPEREFVEKLSSFGIDPSDYVLRCRETGPRQDPHPLAPHRVPHQPPKWTVDTEEIRIGIVECSDRTIVCNLLGESSAGVSRCAQVFFDDVHRKPEKLAGLEKNARVTTGKRQLKAKELAHIFMAVLRQCTRGERAPFLDRHAMLETHRLMFQAQDSAVNKLKPQEFDRFLDSSVRICHAKMRPASRAAGRGA